MPIYKTITVNPYTQVKIWKTTESYSDLLTPLKLTPESLNRLQEMKSELHKRAFLSVRYLLIAFGYADNDLYYDGNGKPHLSDAKQISITHSFEFSGVIVSNTLVGIDIEKIRPKIGIIAKKFIGYEYNYLRNKADDYTKKLTIIWCIKESLYKLFNKKGIFFKSHFLVIPFEIVDQKTVAWIDFEDKKRKYNTFFFQFEGFSCAYALPY